jgi:hypothetical protein
MDVVVFAVAFLEHGTEVGANDAEAAAERFKDPLRHRFASVLEHEDQVHVHPKNAMASPSVIDLLFHRPNVL